MLKTRNSGFTLIELLIVIAVLGSTGMIFHRAMQESYRIHATSSHDEKILWLLSGQESVLRSAPYNNLTPGTHQFAPDLLRGVGIPGATAYFRTEDVRVNLKKISLVTAYPTLSGSNRTLSVVMYRSNRQ